MTAPTFTTTVKPNAATPSQTEQMGAKNRVSALSEAELFRRYLDAPVQLGETTSALVEPSRERPTAREYFHRDNYAYRCIDDDVTGVILEYVERCKRPSIAIKDVLQDLEELVEFVVELQRDFGHLAEVTRIAQRDRGKAPRYVIPESRLADLEVSESAAA